MSDYGLQSAEIQAVLLRCVEELWWAGNGSRGQGLHTEWQFLLDQHDSSGAESVLSQTALGTQSGSAVGRWCERLQISIHLCMWPEKQPDLHKIKVTLLCQSSSEYHPRPETGGFCAIHSWINRYCQGPVCAKIRHWWIQQRRTYPVHNFVPEFLHLITAFSCYPKWHRKLRGRFSASLLSLFSSLVGQKGKWHLRKLIRSRKWSRSICGEIPPSTNIHGPRAAPFCQSSPQPVLKTANKAARTVC